MAGGAALFFFVLPSKAVLADVNGELINFYRVLRDRFSELRRRLNKLSASENVYYAFRESNPRGQVQRAVRFAYLNRLAWNGLYRVNRSGKFNVPIGDRLPESMWSMTDLLRASHALSSARLKVADFRKVASLSKKGDFVFFDPPYPRGAKDNVGFNRYTADCFSTEDHENLAEVIEELSKRKVRVMLTLANAAHLHELYPESLRRRLVRSKALISCNGNDRKGVGELVLTNY
jgi:DNA adenine methylase